MEDLNFRIHKLLVHLPMEEKEKEETWNVIRSSAGKVVTKLIFGLRDYLDKDTFPDLHGRTGELIGKEALNRYFRFLQIFRNIRSWWLEAERWRCGV